MHKWYVDVDIVLYEKHISDKRKEIIEQKAKMVNLMGKDLMLVNYISEDNKNLNDVYEASLRTGIQKSVSKYRQLYVLQIIRFWVEANMEVRVYSNGARKRRRTIF